MIVYKTTNLINGKEYIGLDTKNNLDYYGSGIYIKRAIKKYSKVNFKKRILCKCNNIKELKEAEIIYIELYNTFKGRGYNLTAGGEGLLGFRHSQKSINLMKETKANWTDEERREYKKRNSEGQKGKHIGILNPFYGKTHSKEFKEKMSIKQKNITLNEKFGKIKAEEIRKKISKYQKGRKKSKEHNRKNSESHKGKIFSESHRKNIGLVRKGKTYEEIYGIVKGNDIAKRCTEHAIGSKWMNKEGVDQKVSKDKINFYIKQGWIFGRANYKWKL